MLDVAHLTIIHICVGLGIANLKHAHDEPRYFKAHVPIAPCGLLTKLALGGNASL